MFWPNKTVQSSADKDRFSCQNDCYAGPIYFVIDDFSVLFKLADMDIMALITKARELGMHEPSY